MRKLFLLFALSLAACSKDEPKDPYTTYIEQGYTSVVFEHMDANYAGGCSQHKDYVAGYFDEEGYCWKIASLGDLTTPKQRTEEFNVDNSISEIYLFYYFLDTEYHKIQRSFPVRRGAKNIFKLTENDAGAKVNETDPKQYPQEKGAN